MLKQALRKSAYAIAPRFVVDRYIHYRMVRQVRHLSKLRASSDDPSVLIETLWRSHFFRPLQKKSEILRLIEIVSSLRPRTICEIGAAGGGTTFLLAQAAASNAKVFTIDLTFTQSRQTVVSRFALEGQKIICLQGDSHKPETVGIVRDCLAGQGLDVLYLDGDHSYEGIKADFHLYSPLVRAGGIIIFHDIVPDYMTRYGIETSSYVGGVPQFWEEIKNTHGPVEEIVEDSAQDGFGIGILYWRRGNPLRDSSVMKRDDV